MGSDVAVPDFYPSTCKLENLSQLEEEYLEKVVKKALPSNYNFEVKKCVQRIRRNGYSSVCLQMPEGLLNWAVEISEILLFFCYSLKEVIIMGDVTYGACCIDDYTATSLGCQLLIHYGHSCLIPVTEVTIDCLYIFVEISFSAQKLSSAIESCFGPNEHILMMGTIQYSNVLRESTAIMNKNGHFKYFVDVPQVSPLLPGEVLGCTSPVIELKPRIKPGFEESSDVSSNIIFIADGRFHLESTLIQNPGIKLYRFDPFNKVFTEESYDLDALHRVRSKAILKARNSKSVGIILSTLGRQGNINIMNNICNILSSKKIKHFKILVSEITIDHLKTLDLDCFIQIGCPRLSIDWGDSFPKPLLNPYEAYVAFKNIEYKSVYPMDYYSKCGGEWTNHSANASCCKNQSVKESIKERLLRRTLMSRHLSYSK
uniref:2-(3-amino-3-carboxypropyl)histidine synthase subunit 1 n=1 Tax=Theileria annulata TaxID=5874 RepID=A0A3B0MPP5_THEAN